MSSFKHASLKILAVDFAMNYCVPPVQQEVLTQESISNQEGHISICLNMCLSLIDFNRT